MHILHLGKFYPPFRGGMETVLQNIAEGLLEQGHDVTVVAAGPDGEDSLEAISGNSAGCRGRLIRVAARGQVNSQPLVPGLLSALGHQLASQPPDIVHLHLPNPLAAAVWLTWRAAHPGTRPLLAVWHHADITRQRLGRRLVWPLVRGCLKQATGICVSSAALREGSGELAGFAARTAVIPFGIREQPWCEVQGVGGGPFLFIGRLVPYKGVATLLEAISLVDGSQLVVVGDGPQKEELLRRTGELGLAGRVRFVGSADQDILSGFLAEARALVLPSTNSSETFGLVQLEAMASGVPVVVTDLPTGVREVGVPGETGLLVPPGDPRALAAALGRLQADDGLVRRLGRGGRRRFLECFTRDRMTRELLEWYGSLLAGGP